MHFKHFAYQIKSVFEKSMTLSLLTKFHDYSRPGKYKNTFNDFSRLWKSSNRLCFRIGSATWVLLFSLWQILNHWVTLSQPILWYNKKFFFSLQLRLIRSGKNNSLYICFFHFLSFTIITIFFFFGDKKWSFTLILFFYLNN